MDTSRRLPFQPEFALFCVNRKVYLKAFGENILLLEFFWEKVEKIAKKTYGSFFPFAEVCLNRLGNERCWTVRKDTANYEGHSLTMLKRIAAAVDKRVEIRFVSRKGKLQAV